MGSPWKMPTKDQCQELIDSTNSTWTTINSVNGYKFTNKSNSTKYIFLPAAGGWGDVGHFNASERADYWSTSIYTPNTAEAWYIEFSSSNVYMYADYFYRYYGFSIRPVK